MSRSELIQDGRKRQRYHHGHLRQALVEAGLTLVTEKGPHGFSMADAARAAGVSVSAPYRHFSDKNALLEAICDAGFNVLTGYTQEGRRRHPDDPREGLVTGNLGYLRFAIEHPELFRLMFSRSPEVKSLNHIENTGRACFSGLLDACSAYLVAYDRPEIPTLPLALRLWSTTHGTASLVVDGVWSIMARGVKAEDNVRAVVTAILEAAIAGRDD